MQLVIDAQEIDHGSLDSAGFAAANVNTLWLKVLLLWKILYTEHHMPTSKENRRLCIGVIHHSLHIVWISNHSLVAIELSIHILSLVFQHICYQLWFVLAALFVSDILSFTAHLLHWYIYVFFIPIKWHLFGIVLPGLYTSSGLFISIMQLFW